MLEASKKYIPQGYYPNIIPLILNLSKQKNIEGDTLTDPFAGGEPPRTSNKIIGVRKIESWENFFLNAAIDAVRITLGEPDEYNFSFFSAITGDMFAYLYGKGKPCDSGITNYFFVPQVVKKAFEVMGYECTYISQKQIRTEFHKVMAMIKDSIDKGIPVISWGMVTVTMADGAHYDPLPEGCYIGGYDVNDILYVNLYLDGLTVDDNDYCTISNGLTTAKGLFVIGKKIKSLEIADVYQNVMNMLPVYLTLESTDGYSFGKEAFYQWADTLLDDTIFSNKSEEELANIRWDYHCTAYCMTCTSLGRGIEFFKKAIEIVPEFELAKNILPQYEKLLEFNQQIWDKQGGFEPPLDKLATHEYRSDLADILREMGDICDEIVAVYVDN